MRPELCRPKPVPKVETANTRAAQELIFFSLALRYVLSRLRDLTPGINANVNTYLELVDEKDELTQRVKAATLKLHGTETYFKKTGPMPYGNVLFLPWGGTRRTG